ncbi:MAG TPA: hypothetical protein VFM29_00515, partial [Vicinamibacteria bacterium]|nr:hypothetical protein [Vicinamibacteria bacterium]
PRRMGFVEGQVDEPAAPRPPEPEAAAPLPGAVQHGAGAIADDEIREMFERSAARYLSRRR